MVGIILMAASIRSMHGAYLMVRTTWYPTIMNDGIYGYIMVLTVWCPPSNGVTLNCIICHKW